MSKHITRGVLIASALGLFLASQNASPAAQAPPACGVDLRVLVMSADGSEVDLPAIQAALDYQGTPYDLYIATAHPGGLTAASLADGCHARYQGVILTTDNLVHALPGGSYAAALTPADAATLADYEATFAIRQVTWYTYPTPAQGFNYPTTASGDPLTATATARGAQVFPYLNPGLPIPIQYSWTYLTTPLDASTSPLLTDAEGHSLAAIHVYPDGRENLAMTFDSNPYMTHAMLLSYGIVNWVTRGLFIGDRHVYVSPQVDDVFIDDARWTTSTACGTDVDLTGVQHRMTGADLTAVSAWQTLLRSQPQTADLRLTMAFNGLGTTSAYTVVVGKGDTVIGGSTTGPAIDTLTPAASALQQEFYWVSHTYNHENLDAVGYFTAASEITQNNATADALGFVNYARHALVQPDVSGLYNPAFLLAAANNGVRYLLSDTSKPGQGNPSPNVGFWSASQPGVFVIPRRANNLFFNVATPAEWIAEYNCHYNAYWGRDLTYEEVLDQESGQLVADMLRGELDPWMFHQTNLAAYDGTRTLISDLLDATLAKYSSYTNLPILSPSMEAVGARMAARTTMRTAGISAMLQPGVGLVLTSPADVTVPVTGLNLPGAELYGGQWISWVALKAGVPTVAAYSVVESPAVSAGADVNTASASAVTLAGTASDGNSPARPLTFAWMQTAGPAVALTGAATLTPSFTAPALAADASPVTLAFTLTADNGSVSKAASTNVTVYSTNAPAADAGTAQSVASGDLVTLAATASDSNTPVRPLTFSWTQTGGPLVPLANETTLAPSFTAPTLPVGTASVTLTFTLHADNGVLASTATTTVVVNPPVGAPDASLPLSQTVNAGAAVTLAGTATDPNVPARLLTYTWTQNIVGTEPLVSLASATTLATSFTAPSLPVGAASVTLTFTLLADNGVLTDTATTTVVVNPPIGAPTANAGLPQTVGAGAPVLLAGTATDPNVPARSLTYAWTQKVGGGEPLVSLTSPATLTPAFTSPSLAVGAAPVTLTFALTVDNGALSTPATTTVQVNPPIGAPVETIGPAQTVEGGATVTLTGAATDPNLPGLPVTFAWSQTTGPLVALDNAAAPVAHFTAPALNPGDAAVTLSFTLLAGNGLLTSSATTAVVVRPPVPALAPSQTLTAEGAGSQTTTLTVGNGDLLVAFVSSDGPAGAPQTTTVSGAGLTWTLAQRANTQQGTSEVWSAVAPAAATDVTVTADQSAVPGPDVDGYYLSLTVMTVPDARGVGAVASAGAADGPAAVSLVTTSSGSLVYAVGNDAFLSSPRVVPEEQVVVHESTGPLGDSHWLEGFAAGAFAAVGAVASLSEEAPAASAWNFAAVEIVNRAAPSASAGTPQTVGSGVPVALAGTASDAGDPARPLTYAWSQTSGPAVALVNPGSLTPSFGAPAVPVGGSAIVLGFTLTVSNGVLSSASPTTVHVDPAVGSPSVNAGAAQSVAAGALVSLGGSAVDPNLPPRPLSYAWTQISGPAVALTDADTPVAHFAAPTLVVGMPAASLGFSLAVNNGIETASATTTVVVDPPIGAPGVTTGPAQTIASGIGVNLVATAADPNVPARPLTYLWAQTGGTPVTLVNPTALAASFIAPVLGAGTPPVALTFSVTADNGVSSSSTATTVTVVPAAPLTTVQAISTDGTGARTTAPFAINAGDLVVAFVAANGPNGGTQTATVSGAGLAWTLARRVNSQRGTSEVWSAWATTAQAAATVTATLASASNPASLTVMTFAGAGGVGATAAGSASSGAPAVSLTTTQPKSLVFGVGNDGTAARARTAVAGQQLAHEYLSASASHWLQTLTAGPVASAGSVVQLRDSAPTTDRWNFAAVEILASRPVTITAVKAATTSTAAVLTWTTSAPSTSRVDYGTAPDALAAGSADAALVTAHAITLHGLTPGATYYFRVTSVDAAWAPSTAPAPPAAPLTFVAVNPAGLVAAYGFSDGAGTSVSDLTGNGNDGIAAGASWTSAGRYGQAMSFDGTSSWITVPESPSLDLTTGMTLEAWVNPATLAGWQSILYKERPDPVTPGMAWSLYSSDSNAPPAVYGILDGASGSGLWTHATGTALLPLNTWSHIAASYDGSALRLYVNGVLVRTLSLPGHLATTSGPLRIGGNAPSIPYGGQFFNGLIDEIRVYNRALSQADIQADMTTRLP